MMIETAKIYNLSPEDYLRCVFERAPYCETTADWEKLLPGTLKLHRSSLAASGKMIKRKKHPVIGRFFFVQILVCFDGYNMVTYKDWRFL